MTAFRFIEALSAEPVVNSQVAAVLSLNSQAQAIWEGMVKHQWRGEDLKEIQASPVTEFEIGCGAWRAVFTVEGETVCVQSLEPAYPMRFLTRPGYDAVPDREAQMAFLARWPAG